VKVWFADNDLEDACVAIAGIPLDETGTFLPGTHLGAERIRSCAEAVESYSPYFKMDLSEHKISDIGDMDLKKTESMSRKLALIREKTGEIMGKGIKPLLLGGEHTLTLGAVQAVLDQHADLIVLQLDAHADLRDVGERGNNMAHDTVMRRILDFMDSGSLIQVGLRSFSLEELEVKGIQRYDIDQISDIVKTLDNRPFWLTFDLDVLDSTTMPAVGNPEPAGATYKQVVDLLLELKGKNVVGADLVEFNPLAADFPAPCVTAANLLRELCCLLVSSSAD